VTAVQIWRDKLGWLAITMFSTDVLAYLGRLLLHRQFYEGHYKVMVICAEAGFVVSIVVVILALIGKNARFKVSVIVTSLVLIYLWFSDIAWWVMVK
jgi:hypothetical protein